MYSRPQRVLLPEILDVTFDGFSVGSPGETRLHDVQIVHSLSPEGFTLGLYLSRRVRVLERWRQADAAKVAALLQDY